MGWKPVSKAFLIGVLVLTGCTTSLAIPDMSQPWANSPSLDPVEEVSSISNSTLLPSIYPETPVTEATTQAQPTFVWAHTSTPVVLGLEEFRKGINPLTGLSVDDPTNLQRRPLLIKVSNFPRSGRPHAGLSYADIVFEYYIGEQTNRFLALYYGSNSPQVGPLRSGRLIDVQLTSMYCGFLIYGGADPKVDTTIINVLQERAFTHNITPCPPICGKDTHSVSGVFVDSKSMTQYAVQKGVDNTSPNLTGLLFDPNPPKSAASAINIGIEYSFRNRGEWHYDINSSKYLRWIEEDDHYTMIPLIDRVNQQQLSFSNIIVLFVTYQEYAPTLHEVFVWDNQTGNPGWVYRDGLGIEVTWRVPDHEQPIQLYNKYGLPIALKPGNSWIVFLGQSSDVQQPQDGRWEFYFNLP